MSIIKEMNSFLLRTKPSNWSNLKLKHILTKRNEKNKPELELLSVYRDYGIIPKSSRNDNHNRESLDLSNYRVVYKNDLVMNKMKGWQGSLGVSQYNGIVSPAYIVCKIDESIVYPKYLHNLLRSKRYIDIYKALSYGIRTDQWELHYEDFQQLEVMLPPMDIQIKIAEFINEKLDSIYSLSEKLRERVECYKQNRSTIITQAVTKGLNNNIPMNESGYDLIRKVPTGWEFIKLKYIASNEQFSFVDGPFGTDLKTEHYVEDGPIPIIQLNNITNDGKHINKDLKFVNEEKADTLIRSNISPNSIVIAKMMPAARAAKVNSEFERYVISSDCIKFIPDKTKVHIDFLVYAINCKPIREFAESLSTGSTRKRVNLTLMKELKVLLPPYKDQVEIADYLNNQTKLLDKVIKKIELQIEKLNEYRSSLIVEIVTGQFDIEQRIVKTK